MGRKLDQEPGVMGRPRCEIDWEQFDKLVWVPVLSVAHLADILKVSKKTLERKVKEKYELTIDAVRGQKQGPMRHSLFSAMWKSAMNGNVTSQIWLSKNLFGWSDKNEVDVSGIRPTIIERSDGKEIVLATISRDEDS